MESHHRVFLADFAPSPPKTRAEPSNGPKARTDKFFRRPAAGIAFALERVIRHCQSRVTVTARERISTYSYVVGLTFILSGSLLDSNLLAMVTLWPNMQYRGIFTPTTPARTEPVWIPIRIWKKNVDVAIKM